MRILWSENYANLSLHPIMTLKQRMTHRKQAQVNFIWLCWILHEAERIQGVFIQEKRAQHTHFEKKFLRKNNMRITIVTRVDHVNRFYQYQHPSQKDELPRLDNIVVAASNNICEDLYNHGCTCMFCPNPHDVMINRARLVQQCEEDTVFIKNLPLVCCRSCVWRIPFTLYLYDCMNGYTHIFSNWVSPSILPRDIQ